MEKRRKISDAGRHGRLLKSATKGANHRRVGGTTPAKKGKLRLRCVWEEDPGRKKNDLLVRWTIPLILRSRESGPKRETKSRTPEEDYLLSFLSLLFGTLEEKGRAGNDPDLSSPKEDRQYEKKTLPA